MVADQIPGGPVAVVGTTTWGTTLAIVLARRGTQVHLLARTDSEAKELRDAGENRQRLPGYAFPPALRVTASPREALRGVQALLLVVPANSLRDNVRWIASALQGTPLVVSACKGLEKESMKRMSQVLAEEIPEHLHHRICCLSGPNLAREIAAGLPSSTVVAARDRNTLAEAQELLNSSRLRVYTNDDLIGVELAGSLKNVVALAAGMADGLEAGNNAKAALVSRGLAEMSRLGVAAGAGPQTFTGLAGLGDLIATCYSPLSRNRAVGELVARGRTVEDAVASLGGEVAEGVTTVPAALRLGRELEVELPISELTNRILSREIDLRQATYELMGRAPRAE